MTEKIEFLISKSDLDYTCVQMNLLAESNRQCVNALHRINFSVCFRFKKKFTVWPIPLQLSKKKLIEHYNFVPRHGWSLEHVED